MRENEKAANKRIDLTNFNKLSNHDKKKVIQNIKKRAKRLELKQKKECNKQLKPELTDQTFQMPELPLSEQTYRELQKAIRTGQVKWEQLPSELNHAYQMFNKEKRDESWKKRVEEHRAGLYD